MTHLKVVRPSPIDSLAISLLTCVFLFTINALLTRHGIFSFWAYGDSQMLNAGLHFGFDGFFNNNFLPRINPGPTHSLIPNNGPNGRYFHYPALHAIFLGLIVKSIKLLKGNSQILLEDVKIYSQIFFSIISLTSVFLNYLWLKLFVKPFAAFTGMILFLVFGFYTPFGISLCDQPFHYLFISINLILITKIVEKIKSGFPSPTNLNLLLSMVIFFAARNSIETPIIILIANAVSILYLNFAQAKIYTIWSIKFLLLPVVLAIGIQFFQSFLEYKNFSNFFSHWRELHDSRFSLKDIGSLSFISRFLDVFNSKIWFVLICLALIQCRRSKILKDDPGFNTPAVILNSYLTGLFLLVFLFPMQAFFMNSYIRLYFVHALILLSTITIGKLKQNLLKNTIYVVLLVVTFFTEFQSIPEPGTREFLRFESVFDKNPPSTFWAATDSSWSGISSLGYKRLQELSLITEPDDILVLPENFQGNSAGEVNPIFEFYTQRHAITDSLNLVATCKNLRKRVSNISRIVTLNSDSLISKIESCEYQN